MGQLADAGYAIFVFETNGEFYDKHEGLTLEETVEWAKEYANSVYGDGSSTKFVVYVTQGVAKHTT